jgi:hypothetical protein
MGGGKEKSHESFQVSPATVPEGLEPVGAQALEALTGPTSAAMDGFTDALAKASAAVEEGTSAEQYESLKAAVGEANAHLQEAADQGLPPQLVGESDKELKKLTKDYLSGLDPGELQALAAAEGFEHPTLVGFNTPEDGAHPLVHWLDPAYGGQLASKLAIQAKAAERFAALAEGQTIAGMSLGDVQAAEEAMATPTPAAGWKASPGEVVAASAALHQALAQFQPKTMATGDDGGLGALIAAENHLAGAHCAELGAELEVAKGSGKAAVDSALKGLTGYYQKQAVGQVVAAAHAEGSLSEAEATLLTPAQQLGLLRASTSSTEKSGLSDLAGERSEQLAKLVVLKQAYNSHATSGPKLGLAGADTPEGKAAAAKFAHDAGQYFDQQAKVAAWAKDVAGVQEVAAKAGENPAFLGMGYHRSELTKKYRAWAKDQKLADLRAVAASMGMAAGGASRANVQNFIASSWDPAYDKAAITSAVVAAATSNKAAPPAAKASPAPTSAAGPVPPAATASTAGKPSAKSFAAKHLQIVEALKAHQAVTADLPPRPSASEVASWSFGPAQASHLGGGHTKSVHAAPDGTMWMFKPDKTGGGARAHAEASASEIFTRVGVPSVAVYARSVGGKVGSIQPLVQGASSLSSDPKSWSQADVDNLVRYHVAAWAVGDHDGNASNVIRTPSGGLCPVDQGQAFKFYGQDRLASDYHPNTSYGSVPVFHQAYAAAKAGQLGKGVAIRPEAALPTVKAFERMPDAQYRAILAPVASEGVKHGVHWVGPMRKAAQKRLGKKSVSDAEVGEEFLRTALERKASLRASFSEFYTGLGFSAGAKLKKVA